MAMRSARLSQCIDWRAGTTGGEPAARRFRCASFRPKRPRASWCAARTDTRSSGMGDQRYLRGSLSPASLSNFALGFPLIPSHAAGIETKLCSFRYHSDGPLYCWG